MFSHARENTLRGLDKQDQEKESSCINSNKRTLSVRIPSDKTREKLKTGKREREKNLMNRFFILF